MIKYSLVLTLLIMSAGLTSCSTNSKSEGKDEISLKADRKLLDQYRTETPEEVKAENDFMALVLKDMGEVKAKPQDVRDRYYKEVRKKRDAFNKQHRQIRDRYNRDTKKKRDDFLNDLKKERAKFVSKKPSSSESSEFFSEQNTKRNMFFQDQSDNRRDFESQVDQDRRDFNDDMNLKQKQFDDAYREYLKNYQEKEKEKKAAMAPVSGMNNQRSATVAPGTHTNMEMPTPVTYPGQDKDIQELDSMKDSGRDSF